MSDQALLQACGLTKTYAQPLNVPLVPGAAVVASDLAHDVDPNGHDQLNASASPNSRSDSPYHVLRGVSFEVRAGERVGIVGPSGCGKSTTARIVARLERPDAGSVFFNGQSFEIKSMRSKGQSKHIHRPARKKRREERKLLDQAWQSMRMVFQNPEQSFAPSMTIGQAVAEGVKYLPNFQQRVQTAGSLDRLVASALADVELPATYATKRAFELSGGECQRAALARAIIGRPRLIICDEPTSALDVTIQARIMNLLVDLHARYQTSFLFISHDLALVNEFCDRIYRMESGRMIEELQVIE